ncbi:hypothetical protein [Actinocorallia sp. A-T 12471]|uniref:hypothetical protein n=1 Tax=Actinocorallia sp. A-T 12471 TaxID=3089813 RepID=UPI0029D408C7|nr:hypothetical protein [Actinocorallia sp. A-T 12471]MDX6743740.1 hypothetical protein [Actinocorallia sp. A-T 12471]
MRRIAAVTVTAVALSVGMGLAAAPAGAAPAKKVTKSWVTHKGKTAAFKSVQAGGKFTRNGKNITVRGYIQDKVRGNGWAPGVQFRYWTGGKWKLSDEIFVSTNGVTPYDSVYKYYDDKPLLKAKGTKLQVRELALKPNNSKKGTRYGAWKKLF